MRKIAQFVQTRPDETGLIYCLSKNGKKLLCLRACVRASLCALCAYVRVCVRAYVCVCCSAKFFI